MHEKFRMKLYSYVVVHDTGFAPNPFWGYCTLAGCTPNHMGIRTRKGDWIIGTESIDNGNKLIYAMQVSDMLSSDKYYNDPRYKKKKPVKNGTWRQCCGDNIYYKDATGAWQQHSSLYRSSPKQKKQDLKTPCVYIAKHFYYFGNRAKTIPSQYESLIWRRQGVKCNHDPSVVKGFLYWLQISFKPGIHAVPHNTNRPNLCLIKARCV
jgi:hypothetical protein